MDNGAALSLKMSAWCILFPALITMCFGLLNIAWSIILHYGLEQVNRAAARPCFRLLLVFAPLPVTTTARLCSKLYSAFEGQAACALLVWPPLWIYCHPPRPPRASRVLPPLPRPVAPRADLPKGRELDDVLAALVRRCAALHRIVPGEGTHKPALNLCARERLRLP